MTRREVFGAVAILSLVGTGVLVGRCTSPSLESPDVVEIVRPTTDVVVAIRDLVRLETVDYHVERVVDLRDRQKVLFGLAAAEDAILLIAAGDVVAGIDLAKLREGDVELDRTLGTVRITLPAPEILSSRLDGERTYVYGRSTDVLARRSDELETRARREAERTLRDAAVEAGVLVKAGENAKRSVEGLVRALGYDDVRVRLRTEE